MKVTSNNHRSEYFYPVLFTVISILILVVFIVVNSVGLDNISFKLEDKNTLDTPTDLGILETDVKKFRADDSYEIYHNNDLSIYVSNDETPRITYVYDGEINNREYNDRFILEIGIKDSLKSKSKSSLIKAYFTQRPTLITINENTFSVFQQDLKSNDFIDKIIPRNEIAFINTGRYSPKKGRSLDLKKLALKTTNSEAYGNDKIVLKTSHKNFTKILNKREEALRKGVLTNEDGDIIKGKISLNDGTFKDMEFRLKGDWIDHLVDDKKWSFRVVMKDGETLKGMRKLSIQHPKVRNYLWEWLFNKVIKDNDIIGLRYDYVDVELKITQKDNTYHSNLGIMALEETFDKILIENNNKREGIILAFDESLHWKDEERIKYWKLDDKARSYKIAQFPSAPIKVFNENKVLTDPKLKKQFEVAKNILESVRQGKLKISEAFDIDKLSTFVALSNLFGGQHGLAWHNIRIYYNPITNKLEPISYDSHSGIKLSKISHYPMSKNDSVYNKKVLEKLKMVSDGNYIKSFLTLHDQNLSKLRRQLDSEFHNVFDIKTLEYNSNFIKNKINPAQLISTHLIHQDAKNITISVSNLSEYDIVLKDINHKDGRRLSLDRPKKVIAKNETYNFTYRLNDYFSNAFVSKKNKKGDFQFPKDLQKLRLSHYIPGVDHLREVTINPYGSSKNGVDFLLSSYKTASTSNIAEFPFIETLSNQTILFKEGNYTLNKDLIIPSSYVVKVNPGFSLNFQNNASIRSQASLICLGTQEKPIKFYSSDGTGGGIFITNARNLSEIAYTTFDNLSNPRSEIWSVSGAVNFHESEVNITHSNFSNNRCEDALNIIRSRFTLSDTTFNNTQSDSFDGDFVTGSLTRCKFINSGNDGIDVSGSSLVIENIEVTNPSDKAISAGENSQITGKNIIIKGGEIGVVSKDLSKIDLINVDIIDTRLGLSAFQKKSEYGVATIEISKLTLKNNEVDYLIENKSSLYINNTAVKTVSNNVIDQMYGKEYGKSSR